MKHLLFVAMLALAGPTYASSYYVSDCGSGAIAGCVAGNDSNDGLTVSTPWRTCAKVTSAFPSLNAGDQVLFAKGSAQAACQLYYLSNLHSVKSNPIVLGAYAPGWAPGNAGNPILNGTPSMYTLSLMNSGNSTHDEGYIVQDLHFIGAGTSSTIPALIMSNDVDYVTIQRVEIEESRGAIQCELGTNHTLNAGSDGLTEHIVIRNSSIHNNRSGGILSSCNDVLIENNSFDSNGAGQLDHHIYLHDSAVNNVALTTQQVVIRNNTLTNNSPYASYTTAIPTPGACAATAITVHGLKKGITIENNRLSEPTVPTSGQCWGISADSGAYTGIYAIEGFSDVVIRGNTIINYALGIGLDLCSNCTVENNVVYSESTAQATGIAVPSKYFVPAVPGNTTNQKILIRNNSIYLKAPTAGSIGIRMSREGNSHTVASNLVYFGSSATPLTACFNTGGLQPSAFSAFDNNLCYFSATVGQWDTTRTTLTLQQAAGMDTHSKNVDPGIAIPTGPLFSLAPSFGSPAINAGHPTLSSKLGVGGLKRDINPDIGAAEYNAVIVVPSSPTQTGIR